jgi:porphobilinogen deaminase
LYKIYYLFLEYIQKKISDDDLRIRLRKRYFQLTEVKTKRKQQRLQEEARCNKLMAKIFCKKLQQKVLKGEVDLSHSVSVLSNL